MSASQPPPHPHALRDQHAALQPHIPFPPPASSSHRQKSSPDDLKYIQKYKDLKQKVKDIELDNDKLHLKVLKTRKNLQRLRIERAILYERLSTMPAADLPPQAQQVMHPQQMPYPVHPQYTSGTYSPQGDPHMHPQSIGRRHPDPQDAHAQSVFARDVHLQIQSDKDRHRLEAAHRAHPDPRDVHPMQSRVDPPYPLGRPPSPPRHHHPDSYPPNAHPQQAHAHIPMEVDRPPPPPLRTRRPQAAAVNAHAGPSREGDRNSSLPASLPPPPNTLPFGPPHPHVRQGSNAAHSPREERAHGPPGHPSEAGYPHYASTHRGPPQRDRERDHERGHLGGPGLPPMRTHHPDAHSQSPRPASSSSHNGYAHPLQHPFSSPEDRGWERERDFAPYPIRGDDRMRERERHEPGPPNGYRDGADPPHRYDGPPSHGNGSALPSPDASYMRTRRSSQSHVRTDISSAGGGRAPQERDPFERREYQQYEYARRQDREAPDAGEGLARRRSFAEMSEERDRERAHEAHRPSQKRRASQDEFDDRRHVRRDRERERDRDRERVPEKDRDRDEIVPRVREGEPMD